MQLVFVPQGDDRGVDVAEVSQLRHDPHRPRGEHLDHLAADDVAGHVEVVDGHVEEDARPKRGRRLSGGGPGSRLVIRSYVGARRPAPPATASRTAVWEGSKRRLKPTMSGGARSRPRPTEPGRPRPDRARSAFRRRSTFPAWAASMMSGTWVSVGAQMATASMAGSCSMPGRVTAGPRAPAPTSWPEACGVRDGGQGRPGTRSASNPACIRPIRPAPITPTADTAECSLPRRRATAGRAHDYRSAGRSPRR